MENKIESVTIVRTVENKIINGQDNCQSEKTSLLRGVSCPSKFNGEKEPYNTRAAYEIKMNSKETGNPGRSVTLAGVGSVSFSGTGFYISHLDTSRIISISPVDDDSGHFAKEHMKLANHLQPEKVIMELQKLTDLQKNGGRTRKHISTRAVFKNTTREYHLSHHNELTYDIRSSDISGIYYTETKVWATEDNVLPGPSAKLQAAYLQKEYERIKGIVLPLYHYNDTNGLFTAHESFSDEMLVQFWEDVVNHYLEEMLNKEPTIVLSLSTEEIKISAVYNFKNNALSPDWLCHDNLKLKINEAVEKIIVVKKQIARNLLSEKGRINSYEKSLINIDNLHETIYQHYTLDIILNCRQFVFDALCDEITKLYFYELSQKDCRQDTLKQLIQAFFDQYFQVNLLALKSLKRLLTLGCVDKSYLYEIIKIYVEKDQLDCQYIPGIYELIDIIDGDHRDILTIKINEHCERLLNSKTTINFFQEGLPDFLAMAKKRGFSDEKISKLAVRMLRQSNISSSEFISLMEYIQSTDELMDKCVENFSFGGVWNLLSNVVTLEDQFVKARYLEIYLKTLESSFKYGLPNLFSKVKQEMDLIILKKGFNKGLITQGLINIIHLYLQPLMDKYFDENFKNSSRYFHAGASSNVINDKLKPLMMIYSRSNPEFGAMPLKPFKLLMIVGMKIIFKNPRYIEKFLKQLDKVVLPVNVENVLDSLLKKSMDYYPDALQDPRVYEALNLLHPEFKSVLKNRCPLVLNEINVRECSVPRKIITARGRDALVYAYKNYLINPFQNENSYTQFPVLYLDKNKEPSFSPSRVYTGYIQGQDDSCIVYRSNHGLPHTALTLYYLHLVVDFNLKHGFHQVKDYIKRQTSTPEDYERFIEKLQIAMGFYVTGREGEQGFETEEYMKYREKSASNFEDYVISQDLLGSVFKNENELKVYKASLKQPYLDQPIKELDNCRYGLDTDIGERGCYASLRVLMYGAHCVDLIRLRAPYVIQHETIKDLMKAVPDVDLINEEIRHDALLIFKVAAKLNILIGNSVVADYDVNRRKCISPKVKFCDSYNTIFPKTDLKRFIHYSTSPDACVELLNSISSAALISEDNKPSFIQNQGLFATKPLQKTQVASLISLAKI
ncbi:MAG: NAD-dependent ubiquitin ligase [Tatlockia sp.]|nr:NAD-dependent ubiquitin ligase [Tatlockia sp.]